MADDSPSPKHLRYGAANRYDALKLLALAAMTVDHLGTHLWPDELWMRAIGRVAFPLFFLLIGWSRSTRFSFRVMDLAVILSLAAWWLGQEVLPLNILYTVLAARMALGAAERQGWLEHGQGKLLAIGVLWLPLGMLLDYGATALLWMLVGRNLRDGRDGLMARCIAAVTMGYHFALQAPLVWQDAAALCLFLALYVLAALLGWRWLRGDMRQPAPRLADLAPLRFVARHSLEYYAVHLLAIWLLARYA